ncbi:TerB family tellurite resistance protein, partial [Alphaproteobacteria bacterium]|nr:TerB family tellurite resistance protein [Alphaproteobacteria bacterium]
FLVGSLEERPEDIQREIDKCINDLKNNKSLHFFTSKINKIYSAEKKIELIEILWEIILADGEVHDYESNLIRRLAGLLYLNDYECGKAKKKVLLKMGINE